MLIMALDTTGLTASAALINNEKIIAEIITDCKKNHSETILPMIADIFEKTGISPQEIDYIACSNGPGSFTGLRIGAATAKGLAFGLGKKIVPVPTLDSMAYNIIDSNCLIVPLLDARRNQAYSATFIWQNGTLQRVTEYICGDIAEITEILTPHNKPAIFLGDGVLAFRDTLKTSGLDYSIAPPHLQRNRASSTASLAIGLALEGRAVDAEDFEIFYIRKPQAEREYKCKTT